MRYDDARIDVGVAVRLEGLVRGCSAGLAAMTQAVTTSVDGIATHRSVRRAIVTLASVLSAALFMGSAAPVQASPSCDAVNSGAFNVSAGQFAPNITAILFNWSIGDTITLTLSDLDGFSHTDGFFHGPTITVADFGPLEQGRVPASGSAIVTHSIVAADLTNGLVLDPENNDATTATCLAGQPPGAPTNVRIVGGSRSLTVYFGPPANNGGSAIIGYLATCTSSNSGVSGSNTGGPTAVSIVVPGLTDGKSYTCTVTATNGLATGPASVPSNALTPIDLTPILELLLFN
jgi:hypothetical protein